MNLPSPRLVPYRQALRAPMRNPVSPRPVVHDCAIRPSFFSRRLGLLTSLALLGMVGLPAQAVTYIFPGLLPGGCSGGSGAYTCGTLALGARDNIVLGGTTPITINFTAAFATGDGSKVNEPKTVPLTLTVEGTTDIGPNFVGNANLTSVGVVTLGANVKYTGDIKTLNAVINVGDKSNVYGNLSTESAAVNVGDGSTIHGAITTAVAGVVTIGAGSTVKGSVKTLSGAINVGALGNIEGDLFSQLAGAITIGAEANTAGAVRV